MACPFSRTFCAQRLVHRGARPARSISRGLPVGRAESPGWSQGGSRAAPGSLGSKRPWRAKRHTTGTLEGVVHVEGSYWLIYDLLPPSAITEDAWLSLQFSAQTVLRVETDHSVTATAAEARLRVSSSRRALGLRVIRGERTPTVGWVSPRYGALHPAFALRIPTTGGPSVVATLLEPIGDAANPMTVDIETADSGAIGARIARGETVDYVIVPRDAPDRAASFFSIKFRGAALWLRAERGRPVEFRALEGREVRSEPLGLSVEVDPASRLSGWQWLAASS